MRKRNQETNCSCKQRFCKMRIKVRVFLLRKGTDTVVYRILKGNWGKGEAAFNFSITGDPKNKRLQTRGIKKII